MTQLSLRQVAKVDLDALLYPYQKVGAAYLRDRKAALLADQMGLGKTPQSIAAIRDDEGALVVCPASLVRNWLAELERFRPELHAREQESPHHLPRPGEVLVTAYSRLARSSFDGGTLGLGTRSDMLVLSMKDGGPAARAGILPGDTLYAVAGVPVGTLQDLSIILADCSTTDPTPVEVRRDGKLHIFDVTLAERDTSKGFPRWLGDRPKHPFTLIADEAHYLKNYASARTRRFSALMAIASRVWLLTGTPLLNRPPDLWAVLQACKWSARQVFGSWGEMVDLFNGKKKFLGGYEWGDPKPAVAEKLAGFMLRRMREDVLPELPAKTRRTVTVPITRQGVLGQDFRFIDAWTDERVQAESEEGGSLFAVRRELAEAKFRALLEMVEDYEESAEPLVVFSCHTVIPDELALRPGWGKVTGACTAKARDHAVRSFQDGMLSGIAGTIGAMGVGLTLTRAAHAVFVDRSFVPAENMQAEDRLVRIGQTRGVLITILVADHAVDRRVEEILERKMRLLEGTGLA